MKCPTCGAVNDPANRFCDQCGTRLEAMNAAPPVAVASVVPVASMNCPNCGAAIVPGQAFCDECGTALTMNTPSAAANAPTVMAGVNAVMTTPPTAQAGTTTGLTCTVCGHQNLPGDRFCDNCGAALTAPDSTSTTPTTAVASADAPTMIATQGIDTSADATTGNGALAMGDEHAVTQTPGTGEPPIGEPPTVPPPPVEEPPTVPAPEQEPPTGEPPIGEPPAPTPLPDEPPAVPIQVEAQTVPVETPPAADEAAPTMTMPSADVQATYDVERQRLNDEIARQTQIITQFEGMQQMFGAATPPAVTQGLADARAALSQAQTDLDTMQPPAPAADPAEVQRLNDEIARQTQIITQFEGMQQMFGAAAPPAVTQGLADARAALSSAQGQLSALGVAPTSSASASATSSATPTAPALDSTLGAGAASPAADAASVAPPAPSVVQGARLVLDDGRELTIPLGKSEVIIGREDPISGIYPEIDLTGFGGETGGVSRQHAKLNQANGDWTLTDLNSTNYTRVDGARIEPNQPVPVRDGSKVQFGRVALTFRA